MNNEIKYLDAENYHNYAVCCDLEEIFLEILNNPYNNYSGSLVYSFSESGIVIPILNIKVQQIYYYSESCELKKLGHYAVIEKNPAQEYFSEGEWNEHEVMEINLICGYRNAIVYVPELNRYFTSSYNSENQLVIRRELDTANYDNLLEILETSEFIQRNITVTNLIQDIS